MFHCGRAYCKNNKFRFQLMSCANPLTDVTKNITGLISRIDLAQKLATYLHAIWVLVIDINTREYLNIFKITNTQKYKSLCLVK